jgi:dienelactone hydrolase
LSLNETQRNTGHTNFLVRTRYLFAAEGFVVAVIDAASDFLAHNHGLRGHRLPDRQYGKEYLDDLKAVINDLRGDFPDLPLWAVGTSRGSISAAVAAAELDDPPDGLVLTSSLTGPDSNGDLRPQNIDLEDVEVPTLIVTNKEDECRITKPEDSKDLKKRFTAAPKVKIRQFKGRITPLSRSCRSLSGHGFFGIEQKVIKAITKFIKKTTDSLPQDQGMSIPASLGRENCPKASLRLTEHSVIRYCPFKIVNLGPVASV